MFLQTINVNLVVRHCVVSSHCWKPRAIRIYRGQHIYANHLPFGQSLDAGVDIDQTLSDWQFTEVVSTSLQRWTVATRLPGCKPSNAAEAIQGKDRLQVCGMIYLLSALIRSCTKIITEFRDHSLIPFPTLTSMLFLLPNWDVVASLYARYLPSKCM